MHVPRIRMATAPPPFAPRQRAPLVSGMWRLAMVAGLGIWALIGSAIGALLGS